LLTDRTWRLISCLESGKLFAANNFEDVSLRLLQQEGFVVARR
jgi:hypothetical protein